MKKQFKKIMGFTLIAIMLTTSACTQTQQSQTQNENPANMLEKIKQNNKIIVGTSPDYPPFEFIISENGESKIVGADIDLAQKIADKIGVKLEIKAMDFDSLLPALQAGTVDILITGMTPDEKRREAVDFTDIYFASTNGVIVRTGESDKVKSEADLQNLKVGVQKGSTQEVYVKDAIKLVDYKALITIPDLILDLQNKNIDAIVLNSTVASINVKQYEGIELVSDLSLESGGDDEFMAIAIKKGENKELLALMNEEIKNLQESGEYAQILEKATQMASETQE